MAEKVVIGPCELYHGDCRDVLQWLARDVAVVSDPPYGMGWNTDSTRFTGGKQKRGSGRSDWGAISADAEPFDPAPWLDFSEVILWGANHYAARLPVGSTLIWLKKFPHLYGSFLSDAEIGWQRGGHGVYALHAPDDALRRMREHKGTSHGPAHPTQKPLALMRWCIERTRAATVVDPYLGSGTTGVAAVHLGRRFIGVEVDRRYFDVACERIRKAVDQPDFFVKSLPPPIGTTLAAGWC